MVSIKFPPAILGPEMAAPILWAPGIFWFFLLENPHAHEIPPFRGGGGGFWVFLEGGGVEVPILFLWAWGFFRIAAIPPYGATPCRGQLDVRYPPYFVLYASTNVNAIGVFMGGLAR